jgi:hypothetical protein
MRRVFADFLSSFQDDKKIISENPSHQPHQWSKKTIPNLFPNQRRQFFPKQKHQKTRCAGKNKDGEKDLM